MSGGGAPEGRLDDLPAAARGVEDWGKLIDETERSFSSDERAIAVVLASEGRRVKAVATSSDRTADSAVDGGNVEFKTVHRRHAESHTVRNALNAAKGQSARVVLDAHSTWLSEAEARRGVARARGDPGRFVFVQVLGPRYDYEWSEEE